MEKRTRNFTDADRQAHQRLRALWNAKRKELRLTQEKVARQWGVTQGSISAYLTGRAALGRVATVKFAQLLRVQPKNIREDFEFSRPLGDVVPEDVIEMAWKIASMPQSARDDLHRMIDANVKAMKYDALLATTQQNVDEKKKQETQKKIGTDFFPLFPAFPDV